MKRLISVCILICTLFLGEIHAQMKSVGTSFSYAGIGAVYEHYIDDNSFVDVQLRMETASKFTQRRNNLGVSASFSWNMIFAEMQSWAGKRISFHAGPGVMVGYADDAMSRKGLVFGLKGKIGGECTFPRRITVSASLSPVIGLHLGRHEGMLNMLLYKNGLLYSIMPEVGIKYAF